MSVQSEINRLTSAKAAIISAITAQGVTVPTGAGLDDLAELIGSIEGGGGISFTHGTFTPASTVASYEVTHNLGVPPQIIYAQQNSSMNDSTKSIKIAWNVSSKVHGVTLDGGVITNGSTSGYTAYFDSGKIKIKQNSQNTTFTISDLRLNGMLIGGRTIYWIALGGIT